VEIVIRPEFNSQFFHIGVEFFGINSGLITISTLMVKNGLKMKIKMVKFSKELSANSLWTPSVNFVNLSSKETKKNTRNFSNNLNWY
jgi:hypothetical protein